jgi:hypothetical protein
MNEREKAYAEAINNAYYSNLWETEGVARAAIAVADDEMAELRAEVERLKHRRTARDSFRKVLTRLTSAAKS